MDIDKFLQSQTFKTGTFVLLVLLVLFVVFKMGFVKGYKKASYVHKGVVYSQLLSGHKAGIQNGFPDCQRHSFFK